MKTLVTQHWAGGSAPNIGTRIAPCVPLASLELGSSTRVQWSWAS